MTSGNHQRSSDKVLVDPQGLADAAQAVSWDSLLLGFSEAQKGPGDLFPMYSPEASEILLRD